MRIKALQLTSHSAFQSDGGRVWRRNLGASSEPRRRCDSQLSADPLGGTSASDSPHMIAAFEKTGYWWDVVEPERQLPGKLTFDAEGGANLSVTVTDGATPFHHANRNYELIHGITTEGERVSLVNCFDRRASGTFSGLGVREIFAHFVIVGFHLPSPDALLSAATVRFRHSNVWANRPSIALDSDPPFREAAVTYKAPPDLVVNVEDVSISIGSRLRSISFGPPVDGEIALREDVLFSISPAAPQKLDYFLEAIDALKDLLSVACLRLCIAEQVSISGSFTEDVGGERRDSPSASIHFVPVFRPIERRTPHQTDLLFRLTDIEDDLASVLGSWLKAAALLRPIRGLYLSALYADRSFLDSRFLSLVQAVEAYHRRFRSGAYLEADEFHQRVLSPLMNAVPDGIERPFRDVIRSRLGFMNEYSLAKRLKLLFEEHRPTLSFFVPDADTYVRTIVDYRNYVTHYSSDSHRSGIPVERIIASSRLLELVIELSLLCEMGIRGDQAARLARGCQAYLFKFRPS